MDGANFKWWKNGQKALGWHFISEECPKEKGKEYFVVWMTKHIEKNSMLRGMGRYFWNGKGFCYDEEGTLEGLNLTNEDTVVRPVMWKAVEEDWRSQEMEYMVEEWNYLCECRGEDGFKMEDKNINMEGE